MEHYIAPEIPGYVQNVIKSAIGSQAEIQSFRWSKGGGLYKKVYCVDTNEGSFIFSVESDKIFPSTRTGQIENEVEGNRLLKQAGILCPPVIAYDLTGKDIGVNYILTGCLSSDWPVMALLDQMDDAAKMEVKRQATEICIRISTITNTHFGSLLPSGSLGWHKSWEECYHAWFNLLIRDCVEIGLFTDDELAVVKAAAEKSIVCPKTYSPTFSTEDMGWHNMIWGHVNDEPDALHVIDFGNARYILPFINEYVIENLDVIGRPPHAIPELLNMDKGLNLLTLYDFEGMLWTETMRLIEDYAHVRDWMVPSIETAKKDTSRRHVIEFMDKCRKIL